MYIVELICKIFSKFKRKPSQIDEYQIENEELLNQNDDYEACEHTFMPLDSTNETLACTKCGIVKKRSELKNKNFFMQK